jgi:hypothetical protein
LIKPCSSTISAFSTANNTRAMRLPMVLEKWGQMNINLVQT